MRAIQTFLRIDDVLSRALDAQTLRLETAAHNLANANTPKFKRGIVRFEEALRRELAVAEPGGRRVALQTTHASHWAAPGVPAGPKGSSAAKARPEVVVDRETTMRNDGNNVDPDREAVELARTQLAYQALARVAAERYRRIRTVVQQGGR